MCILFSHVFAPASMHNTLHTIPTITFNVQAYHKAGLTPIRTTYYAAKGQIQLYKFAKQSLIALETSIMIMIVLLIDIFYILPIFPISHKTEIVS